MRILALLVIGAALFVESILTLGFLSAIAVSAPQAPSPHAGQLLGVLVIFVLAPAALLFLQGKVLWRVKRNETVGPKLAASVLVATMLTTNAWGLHSFLHWALLSSTGGLVFSSIGLKMLRSLAHKNST